MAHRHDPVAKVPLYQHAGMGSETKVIERAGKKCPPPEIVRTLYPPATIILNNLGVA